MAIDEDLIDEELLEEPELKKTTFGTGLLKGLGITLRHLLSRSVTIQYPDEKDILPPRSRGVIALKTENCTVCMLCARECPDWCIYIEGHKDSREPSAPGKRAKKFNVLDRFAIDYALCMYCGICVEVCPYDALFWSPEYEYAEYDITNLTHEIPRLNDWMYYVLPPAPLDEGAQGPQLKAAVAAPAPAPPAAPLAAAPATAPAQTPAAPASAPADSAQAAEVEPTAAGEVVPPRDAEGTPTTPESEAAVTPEAAEAIETEVATGESAPQEPAPAPTQPAPTPGDAKTEEEAAEIRQQVYEAEMAKGSDPRVAEGRAKAAEMRAIKGTKGPQ
ncbi:MAG TPA: NADH-quinone oxidoreductase subunit I [Actinomycetota bacterium]|nr:NADH-quinone oxidoreductase subunit I [Actinomycetota bacterium]